MVALKSVTCIALAIATFLGGSFDLSRPFNTVQSRLASASIPQDVTGDDSTDSYTGTGGLLLPGSFTGTKHKRRSVADCISCVWKYTLYCMWDSQDSVCQHAVISCPKGMIRYRVWFGHSRDSLEQIGSVCLGAATPLTRRILESTIRDKVTKKVPALHMHLQPSKETLTTIPVIGYITSPATFAPKSFSLGGHQVKITALAAWRWAWGDKSSRWYSVRGGRYPIRTIEHRYRQPKKYVVTVTSAWKASYNVAGIGEFPVAGEVVTQQDKAAIQVRSGGTVLVRRI